MTDHADLIEQPVDGGFDGSSIELAEWLWVNLPTRIKWTSLTTAEKALVSHTAGRVQATALAAQAAEIARLTAQVARFSDAFAKLARP